MIYSLGVFGRNVKRVREQLGFSQQDLAEVLGCHYTHLCNIENDNYSHERYNGKPGVSVGLFIQLVNELGLTMEEAFREL